METILFELGTILVIATFFAYIMQIIRQPLIPAYILTGVILGPILGFVTNQEVISFMSEIGVAFLLFIVGLEINLKKLKQVGLIASLGGVIQVMAVFSIAFITSLMLGFFALESAYIAFAIAFSSTMVVVKLLSDRKELDTLHGKIIVGILLLQDVVAIIVLSVLVSFDQFSPLIFAVSLVKGVIVIAAAAVVAKYTFPPLISFAAKSQELLFISAVSISLLYAMVFSFFGFSIAVGAFIAGVSLANLPYSVEIIGKIKSLRDFFSILFFTSLGMNLIVPSLQSLIMPLIIMLFVVIIVKAAIVMFITSFFGYTSRVSFLSGLSLAQISEFSLIMVAQGYLLGHVSQQLYSLVIVLAVITITLTTYLIKFEYPIYQKLKDRLALLDRLNENKHVLEYLPHEEMYEAIICGYDRIGDGLAKTFTGLKKKYLVIDYNPSLVKQLMKNKIPCVYGDIGDREILERIDFKHAKILISSLRTVMDSKSLIKAAKSKNHRLVVMVTAMEVPDALDLYEAGADYVVLPNYLGGEHLSMLVKDFSKDTKKIMQRKIKHLSELREQHRQITQRAAL